MTNIKHGFKKCDIFPYNRGAIESSKLVPSEIYQGDVNTLPSGENSSVNIGLPASTDSVSLSSCDHSGGNERSTVPESDQECMDSASIVQDSSSQTDFTTPLFSSPSSSVAASARTTPVTNPLVSAGLVPENLADILAVSDPQMQPKRRIIKARVLTEDEFYDILKEKERKEKEEQERKEKNRTERLKKKKEREKLIAEKKKERIRKQREKEKMRSDKN